MALSKETTDQIRKEAEEKYPREPIGTIVTGTEVVLRERNAFVTAATAWAVWKEKADGYEKALRWIVGMCSINDPMQLAIRNEATKALEQFK